MGNILGVGVGVLGWGRERGRTIFVDFLFLKPEKLPAVLRPNFWPVVPKKAMSDNAVPVFNQIFPNRKRDKVSSLFGSFA